MLAANTMKLQNMLQENQQVQLLMHTAAQNMTANATSSHKMLETGNPILALFAVGAVLGAYAVYKRE